MARIIHPVGVRVDPDGQRPSSAPERVAPSRESSIEWWFVLLALLPALATAFVYVEAFLASRALGHWPIPSLDDPKDLVTAPLHRLSAILVLLVLPGGIFLAAVSVKNWRVLRTYHRYLIWLGIFVLSFICLLVTNTSRTWEWWWD